MSDLHDQLSTDFTVMAKAATATDLCSAEVRALLHGFSARITAVPKTVWSGTAAAAFQDAVARWNTESMRLCGALDAIAETIRGNEVALRGATARHAHRVAASTAEI